VTQSTQCILTKYKKQDEWEELGQEMNRPADECENKMQNFLSSLRRKKMKTKKCSGTGKGEFPIRLDYGRSPHAYVN
jgi:hypothetical protein